MFRKRKILWLSIMLLIAILGSMGAVAVMAESPLNPVSNGVISAAYQNVNGILRLVNGPEDINPSETYISWNEQGIQGPQGIQGVAGPTGTQGPAGNITKSLHTYYYSVGGDDFGPSGSIVNYVKSSPNGGAYLSGVGVSGNMTAPLHLPQGAHLTSMTAFFYDAVPLNLQVNLMNQPFRVPGYITGPGVTSNSSILIPGDPAALSNATVTLDQIVDSQYQSYFIRVIGNPWSEANLRIKGVTITYEVLEVDTD